MKYISKLAFHKYLLKTGWCFYNPAIHTRQFPCFAHDNINPYKAFIYQEQNWPSTTKHMQQFIKYVNNIMKIHSKQLLKAKACLK